MIFAGLQTKVVVGVATVLAVILLVLWMIHFIQDTGRTELRLETLQEQIEVRRQIDDAISTAPRDVESALELLRRRQGSAD